MFQMAGVFAEFERSLIVEHVRASLQRAKKHGTKSGKAIGRPRVEVATEAAIRRLRKQGRSIGAIAAEAVVTPRQLSVGALYFSRRR